MTDRAISILVHGAAKVGKTTFAMTAPYPRLLLDVEKASRFLVKNQKKYWDPMSGEAPPVADGTWDTCVVIVHDFETVLKAYEWLKSGRHQFRSVILDSISELQIKAQEAIVGRSKMQTQDWGTLLQRMGGFCRDLRDLTTNQVNPLEAVVITSMSMTDGDMLKPYLQGQLKHQIPYLYDITGYLYTEPVLSEDQTQWLEVRRLLTRKHDKFEAGERVQGLLPMYVDYPDVEGMLNVIFGPREDSGVSAPAES